MAKISTYPTDSSVSGGDMLIGTDVDNANATKNFTVSSLISYAATNNLVPYTGATQNVDLGSNDLLVGGTLGVTGLSSFGDISASGSTNLNDLTVNNGISLTGDFFTNGSAGTAGYILTSNGASLSPSWVNGKLTFVPYTGASANVDLGTYKLSATGIDVKTGPLFANGSEGAINQVLVSQGAGTNPIWSNNASVSMPVFSGLSAQGTTNATTSLLNEGINVFSTVTLTNFCTKLPNVASGISVKIINNGATNLRVFPYNPADSINGLPAGAYAIVPNDNKLYEFISL